MSFTVENDPWIDWSVIDGPVSNYLYINLNPDLFDGAEPTVENANFKGKYKPLEATYNGQLQVQNIVEGVFIITQIGTNSVDKVPFNRETPPNPYNYGTEGQTMLKRKPWRIESIPLDDPGLTIDIKYDSRLSVISSDPKNVGRYDITIRATYIRNKPFVPEPYKGWGLLGQPLNDDGEYPTHRHNGTYQGFWSSHENLPNGWPVQLPAFFNNFGSTENIANGTIGFANFKQEIDLADANIYRKPYKGYINEWKFLIINPCPVAIYFSGEEFAYTSLPTGPTYTSDPQLLDLTLPNAPGNVPMRLTYSGDKIISPLAPPIEPGTYKLSVTSTDFNYVGSNEITFVVRPKSVSEAAAEAAEYQGKVDVFETQVVSNSKNTSLSNSSYASSSEKISTSDFIKSGVLTLLEKSDIEALGTISTLAECAKNLPQKIVLMLAAKLLMLILSYIPGLGIINLLTQVMQIIKQVQEIMALIEFIKDNPWAFLNMVLEASGAYAKLGNFASGQLDKLKSQFPNISAGLGDVGGFIKDVANGLVDICNNVDINGNPIATMIKADNTKVPEIISGFIPATSRQPVEAKAKYDFFQFQLRDALNKDTNKVKTMSEQGNSLGVQEYVSMLTAVHELAYNYHDRIAETGSPSGLLGSSANGKLSGVYDTLSSVTDIFSGAYPQSTSTSSSGSKSTSALNTGLSAITGGLGGVSSSLGAVSSFLSGETNFSLSSLKNEFNYAVNETLKKNPKWSKETIKEYKERANRIKFEMENNSEAIRNNPANAKAASTSASSSTSALSSLSKTLGSSPVLGSVSKFLGV